MAFGTPTDHFNVLTRTDGATGTLADYLEVIDSSKVPVAQSNADALDINGDIAEAAYYGNTDGNLYDVTSVYQVTTDSFGLNLLDLGELAIGIIATSISIETDNGEGEPPKITISGQLGATAITAPSGFLNVFALPDLTITANMFAQPLGFTVSAGELQSCSMEASCRMGMATDGGGEPSVFGIAGAEATVSAEFVNTDTPPAWTLTLADLTETQAPSDVEPQAAWDTSSATARVILSRTASA